MNAKSPAGSQRFAISFVAIDSFGRFAVVQSWGETVVSAVGFVAARGCTGGVGFEAMEESGRILPSFLLLIKERACE